jgi:hypothetical protein
MSVLLSHFLFTVSKEQREKHTFNVSTRICHTTNAPMLVVLPLTSTWSVTCTLRAQHARLRSRPYSSLLLLRRPVGSVPRCLAA